MKDINIAMMQGRLTKDPEMKTSKSGTPWLLFTLAVNDSVKREDKWEDKADFLLFKAFGKTAEAIQKFAGKGTLLTVQGRLKCDQYEANGEKKSMTYVLCDTVRLPPKPKDGDYQPSAHEQSKSNGYAPESKDVWGFGSDPGFKDTDEFPLDFGHGEEVNIPF